MVSGVVETILQKLPDNKLAAGKDFHLAGEGGEFDLVTGALLIISPENTERSLGYVIEEQQHECGRRKCHMS